MSVLSNDTKATLKELHDQFTATGQAVLDSVEAYRKATADPFAELQKAFEDYNDLVTDWNDAIETAAQEIEDYMSERSEKWQEGEAAERHNSWKAELEGMTLEPIEVPDEHELNTDDVLLDPEPVPFDAKNF